METSNLYPSPLDFIATSSSSSAASAAASPSSSSDELSAAISLLSDVILNAESTIKSSSSLLSSSSSSASSSCCVCLFDPRHQMPPESLFRHSLICSSAPAAGTPQGLGFLHTLRYPNSLKPHQSHHLKQQNQSQNCFLSSLQPLADDADDLCFSLDDDDSSACRSSPFDFFYKDCPAVVSLSLPQTETTSNNKTFLLPAFLAAECANFINPRHNNSNGDDDVVLDEIKLLPSDFWALKCQAKAWTDYPSTCTYTLLRVASLLNKLEEEEEEDCGSDSGTGLKTWIISTSPRFGILIDSAMRDHVFLLLKLCLKAIRAEALQSLHSLLSDHASDLNLKALSFESPRLVRSMGWLASQLSVLYGEANAKLFALGMLRESLLHVGLNSMLFGHERSHSRSVGLVLNENKQYCDAGQVYISQVAAAVAALHERFLLEERIRALRSPLPLDKYQLLKECSDASTRACEIRKNRPNYRAISEHDGLFWHQGNSQDSGKSKTREELLAEERDYKRRRMSYRGKKAKRNRTEVLRDIIEEHMEEIIRAGGIGCSVTNASLNDKNAEGQKFQHGNRDEGHERKEHKKLKTSASASPLAYRDLADLNDQFVCPNEQGNRRAHAFEFQRAMPADYSRCTGHGNKSNLEPAYSPAKQGHTHISETRNGGRSEYFSSKSVTATGFEDRYDPSTSYDECADPYGELPVDDNNVRSIKHSYSNKLFQACSKRD